MDNGFQPFLKERDHLGRLIGKRKYFNNLLEEVHKTFDQSVLELDLLSNRRMSNIQKNISNRIRPHIQ